MTALFLTCSCCGNGLGNNAKENVAFGQEPYPFDEGFGMCRDCGGDPEGDTIRKKMGWATATFCEARFNVLRSRLNEKNRTKFDACSYEKKCLLILSAVEDGYLV